jgi:hypothetical protein
MVRRVSNAAFVVLAAVLVDAACSSSDDNASPVNATGGSSGNGGASGARTGGRSSVGTGGSLGGGGSFGMAGARHDAGIDATFDASPLPPCENGVKDGAEDGVDCGFSCNKACVAGRACASDAGCGAGATPLSGVHRQGLVLTKAGSPYVLTADTQVAGTLVVEPGVVVTSDFHFLRAESVSAVGTCGARITLVNTHVDSGTQTGTPGNVVFRFVDMLGGSLSTPSGDTRNQRITISDSRFRGTNYLYLSYPPGNTVIERNVFLSAEGINLAIDEQGTARIASNYFEDVKMPYDPPAAIVLAASYGTSTLTAVYNTFVGTNDIAVALAGADATHFDARNNYWTTTDLAAIEQRIYDAADDIGVTASIAYAPFLNAPHPSAPGRDGYAKCVELPDSGSSDSGDASPEGGSATDARPSDAGPRSDSGSGSDSGSTIAGACDQISQASVCTDTITPLPGATLAMVKTVCLNNNGSWTGTCPSSGRVTRCEANTTTLGHVIYSYYSIGGTPVTAQAMNSYCTLQGWKLLTP